MTLHILSKQDTVLNKFIAQIRDKSVQKDSMRFRRNLERIGEITAYEISKELAYSPRIVETPLGEAEGGLIDDQVVVATILRAGLPYHQGFLNYFDDAENAFVSAYRKSTKDGKFTVKVEYISCGDLEGKVLLLVDPMLATGAAAVSGPKTCPLPSSMFSRNRRDVFLDGGETLPLSKIPMIWTLAARLHCVCWTRPRVHPVRYANDCLPKGTARRSWTRSSNG